MDILWLNNKIKDYTCKSITYKKLFKILLAGSLVACGISGCSNSTQTSATKKHESDVSSKENGSSKNDADTNNGSANSGEKTSQASSENTITMQLGEVYSLKDKLSALQSDMTSASFESSDENIVSVDGSGSIHAIKSGSVSVTVTGSGNNVKYNVKVKKRGMVYPVFSMMKGENLKLQFSNDAGKIQWSSSDKKIADVNKKGNVTAKAIGDVKLTGVGAKHTYVCSLKVTKKIKSIIYLTFDDGPSRYSTPKILDILKKNNIKATFFELRPAATDFDLTKRVIDEGHTLALHGFQHKYDKIYISEKIYRENLDKLRNMFFRKFGVWCTISRFPGGSSNTVSYYNPGIMTRLTKRLDGWGYTYFDWNVSSSDAGGAKNSRQVYKSVVNGLYKGSSNVVLMHDYTNNDKTINALQKIINYGKKNGYTFLPLSASTTPVHHGVSN